MMGKMKYFLLHMLLGFLSLAAYRLYLFRPFAGLSEDGSELLLTILLVALVEGGYLMTEGYCRTWFNLVVTMLLPFQFYAALTYGGEFWGGLTLSGVLFVVGAAWAMAKFRWFSGDEMYEPGRFGWELRECVFTLRGLLALCFLPVLVFAVVATVRGAAPEGPAEPMDVPTHTIAQYREELEVLFLEEWDGLSREEKLAVLQRAVTVQSAQLGLSDPPAMGVDELEGGTLGHYNGKEHKITIDREHLDTGEGTAALRSVSHEVFHAYQHALVRLYQRVTPQERELALFREVRVYLEELQSYKHGTSDPEGYYAYFEQEVERSARDYAEETVSAFREELAPSARLVD